MSWRNNQLLLLEESVKVRRLCTSCEDQDVDLRMLAITADTAGLNIIRQHHRLGAARVIRLHRDLANDCIAAA